MPTGYTNKIYEGKNITFEEFVLECARAFGANVMMRDKDMGVPIEEYEPFPYYQERMFEAMDKVKDMSCWSLEKIKEYNDAKFVMVQKNYEDSLNRSILLRDRYQNMIDQVNSWTPPTTDHQELKKFMLSQLNESINFDCYIPKIPVRQNYYSNDLNRASKNILEYAEEYRKEVQRTNERNEWNRVLKKSLKRV